MKKKYYLILILSLFFITGCENKEEQSKNEYIAYKNNLLSQKEYEESLPLEIVLKLDRQDEEKLTYQVTFQNPKENMHQIKAMVVNNYNNENVFPSIGLFDDKEELVVGDRNKNKLELEGSMETTKNMSKLELEIKVWIEYIDDNGEKKEVYYKME